jgi:hypothetical protein
MKYIKYASILILAVIGFGFFYINQSKKGIDGIHAEFNISPEKLVQEFETNEEIANKKYLDKIILIEGKINSISTREDGPTTIVMNASNPMNSVSCELNKKESEKYLTIKNGDIIKIKGICSGLLMDVVLVDCVIVNEDK